MRYLMGIDLGTSSVKALITDEKGNPKGIGQKGYEVQTPIVGYAQQDPEEWWECTKQAVRQALASADVGGKEIAGIGFSGQMHGMVALDREKRPVGMAVIHLDQRSREEREEIYRTAGSLLGEELFNQPSAGMLICSLLWMKKNHREEYDRIAVVMSPKDYIRYRLTGEIATDQSDASATLAFSVKKSQWCWELIRRLDLKEDIWPEVYGSCEITGIITKEAERETGLAAGTKVVAGGGDCAAQLVGNGVIEEGTVSCNIGTASQLAVVTSRAVQDEKMRCQLWCHSIPGLWIYQGGALNGGNTLGWLRNKILETKGEFASLDERASQVPAGCEGLLFLPYLAGERTPFNNPLAKGVFMGLSMKHDQAYMVRAVMEGVLYNLRECKKIFDEMQVPQKKVVASGGAAKGVCWKQIQADMLDMPVHTTAVQEEACFGALIMPAVGIGIYPDIYEACRCLVSWNPKVTEPIPEHVKKYQEQQAVFEELYERVEGIFPKL